MWASEVEVTFQFFIQNLSVHYVKIKLFTYNLCISLYIHHISQKNVFKMLKKNPIMHTRIYLRIYIFNGQVTTTNRRINYFYH